jgi:hypothetical protein
MKTLVSNCKNSFDDNGFCLFDFFIDVSDFAFAIEEAEKTPISESEFWASCTKPKNRPWRGHIISYLYNSRTDIFMVYDETEDVHYFFK